MGDAPRGTVALLRDWRSGDAEALDQLIERVEAELHRLARHYLNGERPGHTLASGALVNEAFVRLVGQKGFESRSHFVAIAAKMMRRVLIDHARKRQAVVRGGDVPRAPLEEAIDKAQSSPLDLVNYLAVHQALERLEQLDPRQAQVVELRVFGGLGNDEIAEALEISRATVKREWSTAKAWLYRELSSDD